MKEITLKEILTTNVIKKVRTYIENNIKESNSMNITFKLRSILNSADSIESLIKNIFVIKVPSIDTFFDETPVYEYMLIGQDSEKNIYDISNINMGQILNIPIKNTTSDNWETIIGELIISNKKDVSEIVQITETTYLNNLNSVYLDLVKDDRTVLEKFNDTLLMVSYANDIIEKTGSISTY